MGWRPGDLNCGRPTVREPRSGVLTAATTGIARIVVFGDPGLLGRFGLPPTWR